MVNKPKVLILRTAGTTCDEETAWAFSLAGAIPERVHIKRIKEGSKKLKDYQILVIPGGLSYGNDISAGKVLANEIMNNLKEEIDRFIGEKKPIIGISNGFQVLVKAGILPWNDRQRVSLGWNDSAKFESRWTYLKIEDTASPFFKGMPSVIKLPVAHAEGKFIPENKDVLDRLKDEKLVACRYCDADGTSHAGYPFNPNGSVNDIGGICSSDGLIVGMMPHPERALLKYYSPDWRKEDKEEYGYGFLFFKNLVAYFF